MVINKNILFLTGLFSLLLVSAFAQNVGIHTTTPLGKLHVKGSDNTSQLIIDADTIQGNTNPLIKLRNSMGADLLWIHSDDSTNTFIGLKAGKVNVIGPQGINNSFIGSRAGSSNTNGRDNTAIGTNALFSNSKASLNTAIGVNALYSQSFNDGPFWWQSYNVAVGYEALYSNQPTNWTNGIYNTAIGTFALRSNTTGYQNTAIGSGALHFNTTGFHNTATGFRALFSNVSGSENTAIGINALYSNFDGSYNTATGQGALYSNTQGSENTATGHSALHLNTIGSYNTGTGYQSLYSNTTGFSNTAIGPGALYENSTGSQNTAIGKYALFSNTVGTSNSAVGSGSLIGNTIGVGNVAFGVNSLASNTSANKNVALGANALLTQSYNPGYNWNSDNVAVGNEALLNNQPDQVTKGIQNTAVGSIALRTNTRGLSNTAIGYASLYSNATGSSNTAIGQGALYGNSYGLENTGIGYSALSSNIAGLQNTACGAYSLSNNISGDHNVAIGVNAGTASETPNVINTVSIGNHNYLNAATNQAFLGNLSTEWNGGNVTWSTYSDARVKNNVREDVKGLEFITRLRPVTYYRSIKAMTDITGNTEAKEYPEKYDIEKIKFSGFLAQDVEIAAQAAGYDFSGITVPKNSLELYTLSYEQFVVPLVKAMQEQQVIIITLQDQVDALHVEIADQTKDQVHMENQQKQIDELLRRIETLEIKRQ